MVLSLTDKKKVRQENLVCWLEFVHSGGRVTETRVVLGHFQFNIVEPFVNIPPKSEA